MGGGSSKTSTNIKTKAIVEAMARSIMNCQGSYALVQRLVVSGNYNNVSGGMVQVFKLNSSCTNDVQNLTEIQQTVANAIKAQTAAQSTAVLGALGAAKSKSETFIENEVRQKITNETITNVINEVNAMQEVIISGNNNIVKFTAEQTLDLVMENSQSVLNKLESVQDLENTADVKTDSTTTNPISEIVDSVGDIISSVGIMWVIIAVVAMVVFGWVVVNGGFLGTLFGSKDNNQPPPGVQMMQAYRGMPMQGYGLPSQYGPPQPYGSPMQSMQMAPQQMQSMPPQQYGPQQMQQPVSLGQTLSNTY